MDRWSSNWLSTSKSLPGIRAQRTWLKHTVIPQTITHIHLGGPALLSSPVLYYHWEWLHCSWWEEQSIAWEATATFLQTWCLMAPLGYSKHYLHHDEAAELWPSYLVIQCWFTDMNTHTKRQAHIHKTHAWMHTHTKPQHSYTQTYRNNAMCSQINTFLCFELDDTAFKEE